MTIKRARSVTSVLVGAMVLGAALVGTSGAAPRERGDRHQGVLGTSTHRVVARDDQFRPTTITIPRGDRVRWVNRGDSAHTTTGSSWDVTLQPGERFTKRFRRAGTYSYECTFHSGMTGRVVVS